MSTPQHPPRHTPLHDIHLAAGARMVDFGGWDMPVHYGSQIEEHHAVRRACGIFDVSHMCAVDLRGVDVRALLRRLLANDVDKLRQPGKALYSCMLNPEGGVIDDLIVYHFADGDFRLVLNAATADGDLEWIAAQARDIAPGISIAVRRGGTVPLALLAVQGPEAREKVWQVLPDARAASEALGPFFAARFESGHYGELMIARTGYTGEDGFEIACDASRAADLWAALTTAGARPCGLGARDTLRLEAGMNLYGQDMDTTTSPLDSGLGWTVDTRSERDFIGRAALAAHGQQARQVGLVLGSRDGRPLGVLRAHQTVYTAAGEGLTTSGSFSPTLQKAVALARVPLAVAPGDHVEVLIRDKKLPATVVKLPFVRHGTILAV